VRLSQSHVIARWGGLVDPDAPEGDPMHGVIQGDQDIHVDCEPDACLMVSRFRCYGLRVILRVTA